MEVTRSNAVRVVRFLVGLFFRRVEVSGLEHVPETGGGILIAWHPNGLVDPALIISCFPRRVVFGARHGLFKWPFVGRLMRALGTVPIYRASDLKNADDEARRKGNRQSLDAMAQAVCDGGFAALFPEGVSHDDPFIQPRQATLRREWRSPGDRPGRSSLRQQDRLPFGRPRRVPCSAGASARAVGADSRGRRRGATQPQWRADAGARTRPPGGHSRDRKLGAQPTNEPRANADASRTGQAGGRKPQGADHGRAHVGDGEGLEGLLRAPTNRARSRAGVARSRFGL
ncbi:MAG: 1-acyl-sn-glycerol-3-phosphate acyltransferase [Deltaproteobacteria bacterium]|nr:1-acyl-sn-glycerol-3-phosphate acyltransferase [Deltaproteobacteria bacterium]